MIRLEQEAGPKTEGKAHKSVQMTSYRRVMQLSLQLRRATWVTGQLTLGGLGVLGGVWVEKRTRDRDNLGRVGSRRDQTGQDSVPKVSWPGRKAGSR